MPRRRTLRLRTRVTLFFAFIALLAGTVLIGVTYGFARSNLLDERAGAARSQAIVNAGEVDRLLAQTDDPERIGDFVDTSLRTETDGFAVLTTSDLGAAGTDQITEQVFVTDIRYPIADIPIRLVDAVAAGRSGQQYVEIDGDDYLVVGVHLAAHDAGYFEAFRLDSTESTLNSILTALLLGAAGTLLLATLFGLATSRRLLAPLSQVADAAEDIASGGLDTRLQPESDPDLDRLAGSFNDMADAVQARIEREARFASDVSHELRSPITALSAAIEVLDARRDDMPERTQQALDVVVSQVRRFDGMVIDLLELSRLDAGTPELNVEELDVVALTRRIAARYGAAHVPLDVTDGRAEIIAEIVASIDKVRYERILGNLLDNAQAHGGGAVRIEIRLLDGDRISIAVEDAGPGVANSERHRIFERFARGSAARSRAGTGLGLALVAEHAAALGGSTRVEDRIGGGARFVVELPRFVTTAELTRGEPTPARGIALPPAHSGPPRSGAPALPQHAQTDSEMESTR